MKPKFLRPSDLFLAFIFATAALAAARDANQPVGRGNFEIGTGYSYAAVTGIYNGAGDYVSLPDSIATSLQSVPMRLKLGLGKGFDLRAEWDRYYLHSDTGGVKQGMSTPRLGFRYVRPVAALFGWATLPYATEDFENTDLVTGFELGAFLRKRTRDFRLTALASFGRSAKDDWGYRMSFTPTYLWSEGLEAYSTLEYFRGTDRDWSLLAFTPGVRVDFSRDVYLDAAMPVSLGGRGAPAGWGAKATVFWTPGR